MSYAVRRFPKRVERLRTVLLFFKASLADKSSGVIECHIHTVEEEDSEAVDLDST